MYKADTCFYIPADGVDIIGNRVAFVEAFVITDDSAYILLARCSSAEHITGNRIVVPSLSNLGVATQNATDAALSLHRTVNGTAGNTQPNSVGCRFAAVWAA